MAETIRHGGRAALFRLEFGGALGWGHLVRCGALAGELRSRGWRCDLWTASASDALPADLRDAFDRFLPVLGDDAPLPPGYRWLVVDHYGATDHHLRTWRARRSGKICAIDDEARRRFDAVDLVLNARLGLVESPYAAGVPALVGERYALLRPGLWQPLAPAWMPPAGATAVLVTLGGTDPMDATETVLESLADLNATGLAPIVLRPGVRKPAGRAAAALERFPASVWLDGVNAAGLAGWAGLCRLAVSAAGGTLYELAALRLPFLAVVVAENQRAFAAEVEARWGLPRVVAGPALRTDVAAAVRALIARPPAMDTAFALIDGHGAERVADAMGA